MLFKNLASISSLLATLAAAQTQGSAAFGLIAIHSTDPVQNQGITASQGRLWIGREQNADCEKPSDFATFTIQDEELFLYAAPDLTQQSWVDRSGMGQGIMGYTSDEGGPRYSQRKPFAINADNHLQFDGTDFQACPTGSEDGSYVIWLAGFDNPAGYEDCVGIALRVVKTTEPVSCHYTE